MEDPEPKTRRARHALKRAKEEAKEAKIRASLKKKPKEIHLSPLCPQEALIIRRAPKLSNHKWVRWVLRYGHVRELEDWKPRGKSERAQFRSLVRHLLIKYPIPEFLLNIFEWEGEKTTKEIWFRLLRYLTDGGSLYKATRPIDPGYGDIVEPWFPVPLTRRMCHEMLRAKANTELVHAVRQAQVKVFGGHRLIAQAVCAWRLGEHFFPDEAFWQTVIQWICNQPMFDANAVGPLLDWVSHRKTEDADFSMKGRTPESAVTAMKAWHDELAKARALRGTEYRPSGINEGIWEFRKRLPGGGYEPEIWTITEVLTSVELRNEGRRMKHCVWMYGDSIEKGYCSIWSLQCNEQKILTLEVRSATKTIVQAAGRCNKKASQKDMRFIRAWATENRLNISQWIGAP